MLAAVFYVRVKAISARNAKPSLGEEVECLQML